MPILATLRQEKVALLLGFDALGRHRDVEIAGHPDQGPDDGPAVLALDQLAHEGTVDLDPVEGEGAKVAQRRETRSEIVERDRNPQILQAVEGAQVGGGVGEKHRLG